SSLPPSSALTLSLSAAHRLLHSFPTRRSSDLAQHFVGGDVDDAERSRILVRRVNLCAVLADRKGLRVGSAMQHLHHLATGNVNEDRKSTRLNSSHSQISYAVFCLKKKTQRERKVLQLGHRQVRSSGAHRVRHRSEVGGLERGHQGLGHRRGVARRPEYLARQRRDQ